MAFRDNTTTTSTGTDTMNATWPTVAAHDRAILLFASDGAGITVNTPAGFAFVGSLNIFGGDDQELFIYEVKDCTGSETGNITITTPGTGFDKIAVVMTFSGRDNTASLGLVTTVQTSQQTPPFTISATGITAGAGDDIIAFLGIDPNTGAASWTFTQPSGFVQRSNNSLGFTAATTATMDNAAGGPTGNVSSDVSLTSGSGVAGWGAYVISVPSGGTPPPPPPTPADITDITTEEQIFGGFDF